MEWTNELPQDPFSKAKVWLVMGSAGAGKSTVLARTIDGLLASGVRPDETMYVLFNKIPADAFRAKYLAKGFTEDDLRWWGTHHSIMKRLKNLSGSNILTGKKLEKWGMDNGMELSDDEDSDAPWNDILRSLDKKLFMDRTDFSPLETKLLDRLRAAESQDGLWTHTRYLVSGCRMGLFPQGVRYLFMDEMQDNGKVQTDWLNAVLPKLDGMMLAGDDKQAINGFKGSDHRLFLGFPAGGRVALLSTHRCPQAVLEQANRIISPVRERSPLTDSSTRDVAGMVIRSDSFRDVAPRVLMHLRSGKNVLALVRNNFLKNGIIRSCHEYGLPVRDRTFETLKKVFSALTAVRNGGRMGPDFLSSILPAAGGKPGLKASEYWEGWALPTLRGKAKPEGSVEAYMAKLGTDGLGLDELAEIGFKDAFKRDLAAWSFSWSVPKNELEDFDRTLALASQGYGMVRINTIHGAKGTEEDIVLLFLDVAGMTKREETDNPDGERRVWYVAATRARSELITTRLNFNHKTTDLL